MFVFPHTPFPYVFLLDAEWTFSSPISTPSFTSIFTAATAVSSSKSQDESTLAKNDTAQSPSWSSSSCAADQGLFALETHAPLPRCASPLWCRGVGCARRLALRRDVNGQSQAKEREREHRHPSPRLGHQHGSPRRALLPPHSRTASSARLLLLLLASLPPSPTPPSLQSARRSILHRSPPLRSRCISNPRNKRPSGASPPAKQTRSK
ncbi:hypothetical protein B0H19DRAFT_516668 [Mycena capillaripes]|nr:hypothetical protein B0H19DRAFT_516668 [Mycena capillaripes]